MMNDYSQQLVASMNDEPEGSNVRCPETARQRRSVRLKDSKIQTSVKHKQNPTPFTTLQKRTNTPVPGTNPPNGGWNQD